MALEKMPAAASTFKQRPGDARTQVYPYSLAKTTSFFAELTIARDPILLDPPPYGPLTSAPGEALPSGSMSEAAIHAFNAISLTPSMWRADALARWTDDYFHPKDGERQIPHDPILGGVTPSANQIRSYAGYLLMAVRTISLQRGIPRPKIRLMEEPRFRAALEAIRSYKQDSWTWNQLALGMRDGGMADLQTDVEAGAFYMLISAARYNKVLASDYFAGVPMDKSEDREDKMMQDVIKKGARLACYSEWVATRVYDARLRPLLNYVLEPNHLERLKYFDSPERIAVFAQRARDILNRPTDP